MDYDLPILENADAWQARFNTGWLKHYKETGDFDWAQYQKPKNTLPVSGGAITLAHSRVLLISSAGGYLCDAQTPFDAAHPYGDYSIRVFPSGTPLTQIAIAHDHYDHQFVDADRQVLLPLRHLDDLAAARIIGGVTPNTISFMGYQPDVGRVVNDLIPQIIEAVYAEKADAALLVPS